MKGFNTSLILFTFGMFNLIDLSTTIYLISIYGNDTEAAPIANWFVESFGHIGGLVILKTLGVTIVVLLVKYFPKIIRAIYFCNWIFGLVVINNLFWVYMTQNIDTNNKFFQLIVQYFG